MVMGWLAGGGWRRGTVVRGGFRRQTGEPGCWSACMRAWTSLLISLKRGWLAPPIHSKTQVSLVVRMAPARSARRRPYS